jgi:hypothetical protein
MKGEIETFFICKRTGLGIVAPGREIGARIRKLLAEQHGGGSHDPSQFHGSDLVGCIHAVAPAAEECIPKT